MTSFSYPLPKTLNKLMQASQKSGVYLDVIPAFHEEKTFTSEVAQSFSQLTPRSGRLTLNLTLDPDTQSHLEKKQDFLRVGVLFSGGPAPGGHNVICGLFEALEAVTQRFELIGFHSGVKGILTNQYHLVTREEVDAFLDRGGFHMLGSGRDKIESSADLEDALTAVENFDVLVVIGGDDSNTNAAVMAQYFAQKQKGPKVIGVPKTIDGDLRSDLIETSFGHQSACQVYGSLVSALAVDARSAGKYYHFIRLMGRSASHITLEVALATQPSVTVIAEEVQSDQLTLDMLVEHICAAIKPRLAKGMFWGTVVIPEGIIEAISEFQVLIKELNNCSDQQREQIRNDVGLSTLSPQAKELFTSLPKDFADSLLLEPDAHGNIQISKIESERLLADLVARRLNHPHFAFQTHFFGYEARCVSPSPFDAYYCYLLGINTGLLAIAGLNGVVSAIGQLSKNPECWQPQFESLASLLHSEMRGGNPKFVIEKNLVDLQGPAFQSFKSQREKWVLQPLGVEQLPIQYMPKKCMRTNAGGTSDFFKDLSEKIVRPFTLPI